MQQFMLRVSVALGLALAACSSSSSPAVDAGGTDGPAAGTFGAACVTVTDTSGECMGKACTDSIDMAGHPVCSQTCTMLKSADPSCPTGSNGTKMCNMKGYCRP